MSQKASSAHKRGGNTIMHTKSSLLQWVGFETTLETRKTVENHNWPQWFLYPTYLRTNCTKSAQKCIETVLRGLKLSTPYSLEL